MASASFTRDEVILALDVLYSSETGRVTADSDEIKELSLLLNRLPIHPLENRRPDFRNAQGIRNQLMLFRSSYKMGKKDLNVGTMFYDVAIEFEGRKDELHLIAETIRRNEQVLCATFHPSVEIDNFSEGVLLEHLHRTIEWRDGAKLPVKDRCEVCNSNPVICYHNSGQLVEYLESVLIFSAIHFRPQCDPRPVSHNDL